VNQFARIKARRDMFRRLCGALPGWSWLPADLYRGGGR
jgi:hypothetical protein